MTNENHIEATINSGLQRGSRRIWLEGSRLTKTGWAKGDRFRVVNTTNDDGEQFVVMIKDPNGDRVVSGRERRGKPLPIIEVVSKDNDWLGTGDKAPMLVTFTPTTITVQKGGE